MHPLPRKANCMRPRALPILAARLRGWSRRVACLLCFSLVVWRAWGLEQGSLLARSWAPGPEARQRSVLALMKSRDGYLWIGTGAGLIRFDGVSFSRFTAANTKGIDADHISFGTLWEDASGVIWAGTEMDGVLRDDHGRFETLAARQGLADPRVLRIDGDETGAVWIYTQTDIHRWRNGELQQVHPEQDGPKQGGRERGSLIAFSHQRTIDFAKTGLWRHGSLGLERFAYGHWARFPTPPGETKPFEEDVDSIFEDAQRRVWYSVYSQPGSHYCADAKGLHRIEGLPAHASISFQDSEGFLWVTDHQAHTARWKDGQAYPLPEMQTPFLIHAIEASDGSVWAGTIGTDLFQFRTKRLTLIPTQGSPEFAPLLFRQRDGAIWAGGGNLNQLSPPTHGAIAIAQHAAPEPAGGWVQIKGLSETPSGDLLVGSRALEKVEQLHGSAYRPYLPRGALEGAIQPMLLDASGVQWIGTTAGLYRVASAASRTPVQVLTGSVHCLVESPAGTVWVGTSNGLSRFVGQSQAPVRAQQPWSFGAIVAMRFNAKGELWIATHEHGLVLYDGRVFRALGSADGLPTDMIYSLQFDRDGDFWMGSDVGLIRVRRESIERHLQYWSSRLQVSLLDGADGLPVSSLDPLGNQGSLMLPNGWLWFATERGIAQFDPAAILHEPDHSHASLEEHVIDGSGMQPGQIVLGPGKSNLEIHYTALGSAKPEQIIFRYRLSGYETDWTYAKERRVAYYSHLPPGTYTFQVQSAATDGAVWDTPEATATVRVLTPWYRTGWATALFFLVSLLAGGYVLGQRQHQARRERQARQAFTHKLIATQEVERKRIAHELHDSLGQHLVLIRTLALLPTLPPNAPRGDHLNKIADQAAIAIQEVENISYDLRPYQLDRLGLTRTLVSFLDSIQSSSPIRITHKVDNIDGFFARDMEINVYRILQEALGNVLKHAEATKVTVIIERTGSEFRLAVDDNGRGFATSTGGPSLRGLGLTGMQERAEALGGQAVIQSADGLGTKITVTVTQAK